MYKYEFLVDKIFWTQLKINNIFFTFMSQQLNDHVEISQTISPIGIEPKPWPTDTELYFRQCSAMGFDKHNQTGAMGRLYSSEVVSGIGPKGCGCAKLGR